MALLRPYGRIIQAFGKSPIACQIEYIRGFAFLDRIRGYATVTPEFGTSKVILEKVEIPSNNAKFVNDFPNYLQRKLDTFYRQIKNREIQKRDLLRIIQNYDCNETSNIDDSTCLVLLRCCGNMLPNVTQEDRKKLTQQIWEFLNQQLSQPTIEHYNALLSVYAQNLQLIEPTKFLDSMKVKPDVTTYQLLLNVTAKCGNVEYSLNVLSLMKEMGYSLNTTVFNSLIEAHTINGDVKSALSILEMMKDSKIQRNIETDAVVARAHALAGDIESMMKILSANELSSEQILEIVKSLSISGHKKHIPEVLKFLPYETDEEDYAVINKIDELTNAGRYEDALEIVNRVAKIENPDETNSLINRYLKNLVESRASIDDILEIANRLMEQKRYSLAIFDVCEAALIKSERELAMAIFEAMHEKSMVVRPHYYWPLLVEASKIDGEADIFRTIKHMLCLNIRLDHETLYSYVFPFINTFDPLITLRKLNDLGVGVSVILTPLICHLLIRGNLNETLSLCSKIDSTIDFSKVLIPLSIAYKINRNVNGCAKMFKYAPRDKNYSDEFITILREKENTRDDSIINDFLKAFQSLGIPVTNIHSLESKNVDKKIFDGESMDYAEIKRLQKGMLHPRDMSLDELECHLIELRSKRMNTRGVLRKLLMLQCRENNQARVDEIKREYDENGFLWTPGMYSSLLMFYIRNGREKEALNLYREIREYHGDFKIDDFKIIHLSTALIKESQIDEAIAMLESSRSKGGSILSKECWKLLNTVAHSSRSDMTESILDILVNAGYCERTNSVLGPVVRPHLLKNDLAKAVEIYKRCAEKYRCTPLRQELVEALLKAIKTNDSKKNVSIALLNDVQAVSTRLVGAGAAKMNLFIGLVRNGINEESREFFKIHSVPDPTFAKNLVAIPLDRKLQLLMDILECDYLTSQRRTMLYEMILSVHSRTGDCQAAIELWRKMSKEFKVPSRTFVLNFVSLLEKHNVSLPEDFGAS